MGALTQQQQQFFKDNGYLVAKGLVGPDLIDDVVKEYEQKMRELVSHWISMGLLDPKVADMSFKDAIVATYEAGCDYFQPLDISLPPGDIKPDTPMHAGPAIFNIMVSDGILDAVESLIGPEIVSNPIQHVRIKPPMRVLNGDENRAHITHTAWHQDRGVALDVADQTNMVTVWMAVTEADIGNGCLRVIPGTHKGELFDHCPQPQVGIPARMLDEGKAVPLEVESGDVVMFHPLTVHGAGDNTSDRLRWSFDLRYSINGEPTGRHQFPDFVARSIKDPSRELRDPEEWKRMWSAAKARLTGVEDLVLHRWDQNAPICA